MPQGFVNYHGCNLHCFKDGTRKEVVYSCIKPTLFPYWKHPKDATNSIAKSTRAQLKIKPMATIEDISQYQHEQTWKVSSANYYIPSNNLTTTDSTGETLVIDEIKKEQTTKDT